MLNDNQSNNLYFLLYIFAQRGSVLDTTWCDKDCQRLAAGRWITQVSSTDKSDRHGVTEILLKVALNTMTLTPIIYFVDNKWYKSVDTRVH
jgi:hypothetical protein